MEQLEHTWNATELGVVWSACQRCMTEGDSAGAERLYRLLAGFALAYIRLLMAREAADDDRTAEHALAELIAGLHRPGEAPAPPRVLTPAYRSPLGGLASPGGAGAGRFLFRREGDYWTVGSGGSVSRLRSLRGLEYIAELLRHPYRQIYVVDLASSAVPEESGLRADEATMNGLRISAEAGVAPLLDRRARDDYRARWRELLVEEAEARRDNDVGRADRIQREIAMLAEQLTASNAGSGGRGGPSFKERARVNVRNCISAALRALRPHHDALWRHLCNSIKTGSFCCYSPDRPVVWDM